MFEVLLTCELTHAFVGTLKDAPACGCGRPRIQIKIPVKDGKPINVVGHNMTGLCVGPWIHNKELAKSEPVIAKAYRPLPCFDPYCNKVWKDMEGHGRI